MDLIKNEILAVLVFLLPGLVSSWVFHLITPHPRPKDLAAVVEALLFTAIIQPIIYLLELIIIWVGDNWASLGTWNPDTKLAISVVVGLIVGVTSGLLSNKDKLHAGLRSIGFTKSTSYPSEWYAHFFREERFIILDLNDGRRIQGWPSEWPNTPDKGHFALRKSFWIGPDNEIVELRNAETILVPVSAVAFVEFLKWSTELQDEQKKPATESSPTN